MFFISFFSQSFFPSQNFLFQNKETPSFIESGVPGLNVSQADQAILRGTLSVVQQIYSECIEFSEEEQKIIACMNDYRTSQNCPSNDEILQALQLLRKRPDVFAGLYLCEADFYKQNLQGADFSGTNLIGANMTYANVSGVNFSNANLEYTDFYKANIDSSTIFTGAQLGGAILDGTILE